MLINTVAASAFQLRVSRRVTDLPSAGRAVWLSSAWICAGFGALAVIPLLPGTSRAALVAVVAVAALLHVIGDMLGSAGQWEITMNLTEPTRSGEYQGTAGFLVDGCRAAAPQVVALALVANGTKGLIPLVLSFVLAAACVRLLSTR